MLHDPSAQAPWYRHRWPWLLMSGPAIVIVAGAITTWLAATGNTALVADDYYKQGLTINRVIEREKAAADLGVQASLSATPAAGGGTRIELKLVMSDAAKLPQRVHVQLIHPTRSELDRDLLFDGESGRYSGVVQSLQTTHWKLVIEDEAKTWRLQDSLTVEASGG